MRRNSGDFSALSLSVEYLEYAYWRDAVVRKGTKMRQTWPAGVLIQHIANRDRVLVEKLDAEWDTGRFADSRARLEPLIGFEAPDQLLFRMRRAMEFSATLAADGDRFSRLLQ